MERAAGHLIMEMVVESSLKRFVVEPCCQRREVMEGVVVERGGRKES